MDTVRRSLRLVIRQFDGMEMVIGCCKEQLDGMMYTYLYQGIFQIQDFIPVIGVLLNM